MKKMKEKIKGFSDPRLVGREVYVRDMKMVISVISDESTECKTDKSAYYTFRHDGRYNEIDLLPALSFAPYTVEINENGQVTIKGYSDEIELEDENEPKVGDWGWFWESSLKEFKYDFIRDIDADGFHDGLYYYEHFSKTCPDWIKEIVNK